MERGRGEHTYTQKEEREMRFADQEQLRCSGKVIPPKQRTDGPGPTELANVLGEQVGEGVLVGRWVQVAVPVDDLGGRDSKNRAECVKTTWFQIADSTARPMVMATGHFSGRA